MKTIVIAGNIGKDAETRTVGSDTVTSFSVAVEERKGQEKRTLWFDASIWGKRGDALKQYLTKGSKVAVSGELSTREHDGKTYLTVRVAEVTLQGGKQDSGQSYGGGAGAPNTGGGFGSRPSGGFDDMDDDVPFISAEGLF